VDESTPLPEVEGVLRAKGLHDEMAGRPFAIVEAVDGRVFYAPIDIATAERIGEGDVVRLAVEPARAAVGGDPSGLGPERAERPRVRLQRLGPPLRAQVPYRGPTWLDAVGASTNAPPHPAGALARELAECLPRRAASVSGMGIEASEPAARLRALTALEARNVGARLATERGLKFADSAPAGRAAGRDVADPGRSHEDQAPGPRPDARSRALKNLAEVNVGRLVPSIPISPPASATADGAPTARRAAGLIGDADLPCAHAGPLPHVQPVGSAQRSARTHVVPARLPYAVPTMVFACAQVWH
jgi:hypothetical protein